ncbi:hypothetical protein MF4642_14255 [Acinetobacter sp. MF4642]|uniref:hypothetical protein n=1 Tax=Acinetobacter sp. MF4642 TaxID=1960825 RepID=UPI000994C5F2|nr:hypothetical protein [Acinetobacter sp. MF4642]OOW08321.1 hypothetical protein MF4642_14255 [Acinetobacter sp. MF4642]
MNKHIITILIATFTTSVFAADHMLINGKKVSMNDTRSTLIQKFGQPESGTAQFSNWTIGNLSLYANYQKQGLAQFSVNQLSISPSKHLINIDGKTVYLGKDTIKTATSKFKHACFNFDKGRQGSTYTMTPKTAVKNKLNIVLETTGDAYDVKSISNLPINGFSFTQDAVASNSGCK